MPKDNSYDDYVLKSLGKKLKLDKHKKLKTFKSFKDDGLDYLLEVCEVEKYPKIASLKQDKQLVINPAKVKNVSKDEDIYGKNLPVGKHELDKFMHQPEFEENKIILQKLKGVLNRLSKLTFEKSLNDILDMYANYSRYSINNSLYLTIKSYLIINQKLENLIIIQLAGLIIMVSCQVGLEIGAFFLENFTYLFHETYFLKLDDKLDKCHDVVSKWHVINCLTFLCHLFNFKLYKSKLMFDMLSKFLEFFLPFDIELIIHTLKMCGFSLRKSDPKQMKLFLELVQSKLIKNKCLITHQDEMIENNDTARVKFMVDVLLAIKNNNLKKLDTSVYELIQDYTQIMRKKNNHNIDCCQAIEFDIPYTELIQSHESGLDKWWIVGAAYKPPNCESVENGTFDGVEFGSNDKEGDDQVKSYKVANYFGLTTEQIVKFEELAVKQGLLTKDRKLLFVIIMSSSDLITAYDNALKFITKGSIVFNNPVKSELGSLATRNVNSKLFRINHIRIRELFNLILHCCLAESTFNPYYSALTTKLTSTHREFRRLCEFSLSDRLSQLENLKNGHEINNICLYCFELLTNNAVSLSILKKVNFLDLKPSTHTFLSSLVSYLLTQSPFLSTKWEKKGMNSQEFKVALNARNNIIKEQFIRICQSPKHRFIYESIRLFINLVSDTSSSDPSISHSSALIGCAIPKTLSNLDYALIKKRWEDIENFTEKI